MKKYLLLLPVLAISLTSCGVRYNDNKFFDAKLLKKENIPNLPKPEGKLIRAMSMFDGIVKEVFIQNEEESYGFKYAGDVFDYLRGLSFKHFYTVNRSDFMLTWHLTEKEINNVEDCKYQDNIHTYHFFCSNGERYEEDNGREYIDGIGVVVYATGGTVKNKKREFKYDACIKLCTNEVWSFQFADQKSEDSSYQEDN